MNSSHHQTWARRSIQQGVYHIKLCHERHRIASSCLLLSLASCPPYSTFTYYSSCSSSYLFRRLVVVFQAKHQTATPKFQSPVKPKLPNPGSYSLSNSKGQGANLKRTLKLLGDPALHPPRHLSVFRDCRLCAVGSWMQESSRAGVDFLGALNSRAQPRTVSQELKQHK